MNDGAKILLAALVAGGLGFGLGRLAAPHAAEKALKAPEGAGAADERGAALASAQARVKKLEAALREARAGGASGGGAELARLRKEREVARRMIADLSKQLAARGKAGAGAGKQATGQPAGGAAAGSRQAPPGSAKKMKAQLVAVLKSKGLGALRDKQYREVLAWAGKYPKEAVKLFGPMITDQDLPATVRAGAALVFDANPGIGGVAAKAAIPTLEQAAHADKDAIVRRSAVHALAFMDAEEAVPALEKAVRRTDEEWGVKMNAAFGLARRNNATGVDYLIRALKDEQSSPLIKTAAAQSLFASKPKRALPFFYESLSSKELGFRMAAASAIADTVEGGDQRALKELRALIEKQGESEMVVRAAKEAYNKVAGGEVFKLD